MRLYDTARGEIVEFSPGPLVTMYSCGITPYDAAHLGPHDQSALSSVRLVELVATILETCQNPLEQ